VSSLQASWERRREEWELQKNLADQDQFISEQEVKVAGDQQLIVAQELAAATLQTGHAKAVVDYLTTKFLSRELYEWMSKVLGDVYAELLQQATTLALLAEQQLAFERQLQPPSFIKDDYWTAPRDDSSSAPADRRGLTGSARLLLDVEKLDQYAFGNDRRKLDLSHTFSLAAMCPLEFHQFKSTGVLPFMTPMRLFDQAFPGHYLRLIKRVRVSTVALIPPSQGIRATLTASGLSRVVLKGNGFQTVSVVRDPELVALSSPVNASGVFELDQQSDILLPFESMGVETMWEFQLPKPANRFDFDDIADVFVNVEYTALADRDYRRQVIAALDQDYSFQRQFSLANDAPDLWFELCNSHDATQQHVFRTTRRDFPPSLERLRITQLLLCVIPAGSPLGELDIDSLTLRMSGSAAGDPPLGGPARTTDDGIVSTRRANGAAWLSLVGAAPIGEWGLRLSPEAADAMANGAVEDILMVMTLDAETPPWPQW
jgi:hypothetical protein